MILALSTFLIELRHFFNDKRAAWITTQSCKWLSHMLHTHRGMRFCFQQSSNLSRLIKSRAHWLASRSLLYIFECSAICSSKRPVSCLSALPRLHHSVTEEGTDTASRGSQWNNWQPGCHGNQSTNLHETNHWQITVQRDVARRRK